MRHKAVILTALLTVSLVGAAAAPAASQQAGGEAYAGTHVQYETANAAVADYTVDGTVIVRNLTAQSAGEAESSGSFDASVGLGATTDLVGATISSRTQAGATVELGLATGAEILTHDTDRGVVQFRADGEDHVVNAGLAADASAESAGEKRVVVSKDDGGQGTFIVVGDGQVAVNEQGNVTAQVQGDGQLVYRQYDDGERDESDEAAERMIQNGTATAEVYVQGAAEAGEDGADDGQDATVETVEYGQDTTVEVTSRTQNELNMTVERTESQGKVVLTTVSEEALERANDVEVYVDGEAAVRADSYSAVEQSATEGDQPRYYVAQSSSAEAQTQVAIGIDHFSQRQVRMASTQEDTSSATPTDADGNESTDSDSTQGDGAGFGVLAVLAALGSALLATRRY